ncbi:MAG: peptidoglycan editing factor PgeF [Betaproteobacteria bacterium]|nr:peptidoglycan editing factor PgeF [Betaproteobacteria bacterium]
MSAGQRSAWSPLTGIFPLGVRAGHTGRTGGVSAGPWAAPDGGGLNLGARCGDDPAAVRANRARLERWLPGAPVWLDQVHGVTVHRAWRVEAPPSGEAASLAPRTGVDPPGAEPQADAAVTDEPGLPLAILTADCLPVLISNREGSVVGAAHAGWRGLCAGVIEQTLAAARALAGGSADWIAWLGPAIGPTAFEVGDEVRDAFLGHDPRAAAGFTAGARPGKWQADLVTLARQRLAAAGVDRVVGGGECTVADPQRFYSFRRDRTTGRQGSFIWIDPR